MKRLLTRRTQIGLVGRSTATLAARRWGIAVEVRGRNIRGRLINRRWHGNKFEHETRSVTSHGPLGHGRYERNWGRFDRREPGKVRLEYRIDHHMRGRRQRGCSSARPALRALRAQASRRDRSEVRVEVRVKIWVDVRRCDLLDRIHVGFRCEVHANQAIRALTGLGFGQHGRRLAP